MRASRFAGWTAAALLAAVAAVGCHKDKSKDQGGETATPAPGPAPNQPRMAPLPAEVGTEAAPRKIAITADEKGFHPDRTPARAGESLDLVFTRTTDETCADAVLIKGKKIDLPLNSPVNVRVTMPKDGELVYTCGMKMFTGRVKIVPAG